jgi:hypothetical protein
VEAKESDNKTTKARPPLDLRALCGIKGAGWAGERGGVINFASCLSINKSPEHQIAK